VSAAGANGETAGRLLGGRLVYGQPAAGFRSGIEPVLLAAAIDARPGERVLEAGSGAGAALLCLAARLPVSGLGIERCAALVALARRNLAANGLAERVAMQQGDITSESALPAGPFDHACANPPWHAAADSTAAHPARRTAKQVPQGQATGDLLARWTAGLAARLRPRGSLTLILPAARLSDACAAMRAQGCGSITLFPLWPRPEREAKLMIIRAIRGGRGADRVCAGLVLHRPDGGFTTAADAILREGDALSF
jgi:tRNA1(Val) A37 N6-methylase TrmN6